MKQFEISEDNNTLIIENKSYPIPAWYNRKMIAIKDPKTLQMIFIHHNLDYKPYFDKEVYRIGDK